MSGSTPTLVMLDLDGVLFNESYGLNIMQADLIDSTRALLKTDCILIPNSDTPVLRIRDIADEFLCYQPKYIVAEKGAVIVIDGEKHFPFHIESLAEFRREIMQKFMFKCMVHQGDSVTTMRMFNYFQPNRKILFTDMIREQTSAFYARKSDHQGIALSDKSWMSEVIEEIAQINLPVGLLPFEVNDKYGIAIANVENCSKKTGFRFIKQVFPDAKSFMIGDSMSDFLDDENVVQCAVSNASSSYKEKCSFVARNEYTRGLVEILQWVQTHI